MKLATLPKQFFSDGTEQLRNPNAVGNLFNSPDRTDRDYGKGGKLLKANGNNYKYDEEGNLIEKKEASGKTWRYQWNANGTLQSVTRPDNNIVDFSYDALGRRLSKKYKNIITKWFWDGNKPLHEWKEHARTGEILSHTTVREDGIITWLFNEDNFAPIAKLKGEKKYSIVTDHLGTPYQMYRDTGEIFWETQLDSYGKVRMFKGEEGSCPFRYQGQYEDVETGLFYNRFRYYEVVCGFYISQDPIGLSGSLRLYGYVEDPNDLIDPFGLKPCFRDDKAEAWAEDIIKRNGGVKIKDGHYSFPNKRSAKQAASEIAGDLGSNPTKITQADYRGGPKGWENSDKKIGMHNSDKSAGWRDDSPGHDFRKKDGSGEKVPPHVNAWNNEKGVNDNLHLIY